jgi:hypothetical protein
MRQEILIGWIVAIAVIIGIAIVVFIEMRKRNKDKKD